MKHRNFAGRLAAAWPVISFAMTALAALTPAPATAGYSESHATAFAGGKATLEAWFKANAGPKIKLTKSFDGTFTVQGQADADRLAGTLVRGRVVISASGVSLRNFAVQAIARDPAIYDYAVLTAPTLINGSYDGLSYVNVTLPAGRADPRVPGAVAKERALNAMWSPLVSITGGAKNIAIRDFRIDGGNERIHSGIGGTAYSLYVTIERGEILRTGDDGAKQFSVSTFRWCYIHDLRPWNAAVDGPFYSAPNNARYPHLDALQATRGDGNLVEANWLENSWTATATAGGDMVKPDSGQSITRYTLRRNYMAGGNNYVAHFLNQSGKLDPGTGAIVKGVVVSDNMIGRAPAPATLYSTTLAAPIERTPFSAPLYADQISFSGNVWADTGAAVKLPWLPVRP